MLELWYGTFIAEGLLFFVPVFWRYRRIVAVLVGLFMLLATAWLGRSGGLTMALPLGLLLIFRLGNMLRIIKNRMHEHYLRHAIRRTTLWLLIIHSALLWLLVIPITHTEGLAMQVLLIAQLLAAGGVLLFTVKNIIKLRFKMPETYLSDQELPTVTVAIPARNETTDLEECLRSILANDYPKLEIIVLDDCSQAQTAEIIRSFAHDGVRFVQGQEPMTRWLAKNQAYQKLYEEASGDLILFCGVDVRFGPHAIRNMVNLLHARQKSMLSILPTRAKSSSKAAFIQPMRYWWELALPRRLFNRPAVLSTCWLINRKVLKGLGGFEAVCHAIIPEGFFARALVKSDQYSFLRSSNDMEVNTVKPLSEQRNTAIRMRYPQIRRRPENALMLIMTEVTFLLLPFVLLGLGIWQQSLNIWLLAATCLLLVATHVLIVSVTNPANSLLAVFNFPLVVVTELILGIISMLKYEFSTVEWKDRNICIPVMHVIPKLPELTPEVTED